MKKYTDVDIIAELQKLVDRHVDSYKEDFDIDKRIIRRAAESRNPEDKTLMWFCRPHGTHCLNENQVFIQGTRDHNTFRFYAEQTYDECTARVIVPKAVKRGKVFGDVFEINYREQAANVAQNSVAPDHDRLTFADGYVLDAPCRSSFDEAMDLRLIHVAPAAIPGKPAGDHSSASIQIIHLTVSYLPAGQHSSACVKQIPAPAYFCPAILHIAAVRIVVIPGVAVLAPACIRITGGAAVIAATAI